MRAILATLLLAGGLIWLVPSLASAANVLSPACEATDSNGQKSSLCTTGTQTKDNNSLFGPDGVATKLINLFSAVIGIAAVIAIMIGGIRYAISSGDQQNISGAKDTILYAIIGLAVAGAAQILVRFVLYNIK